MKVFSPLLKTLHEVYGSKSHYQKLKAVLIFIKKVLDFTDPTNDKLNAGITMSSQPTPMQKQAQAPPSSLVRLACLKPKWLWSHRIATHHDHVARSIFF